MKTLTIPAGRKVWVTSDTHWDHRRIIGYCRRPWLYFDTDNKAREVAGEPYEISDRALAAHNDALIDNINLLVHEQDALFILGDVAWNGLETLGRFREQLRCQDIHVLIGNHDDEADLRSVFGDDRVHERLMLEVDGSGGKRKAVLDHFAGFSWEGSHKGVWNLFGHTHGALDRRHERDPQFLLTLDVGVDSHDFRPWSWHDEIVPLMDRRRPAWKEWCDATYSTPKEKGGMATNAR